jgi:methyltransferase family protein
MMDSRLHNYLTVGHRRVEGWLSPDAMSMILRVADMQRSVGIKGNVAEIGIHHGRLFILLYLLKDTGEIAVAIDLFEQQELNIDRSGRGDRDIFTANLRRHADTGDLIIHAGDSTKISGDDVVRLAGGRVRLFSIDGGHTAPTTEHDLATADQALAVGGVVILDDYFNEQFPEVSVGTMNYFREARGIVPFAIGGNKVMFCDRAHAAAYAEGLKSCAREVEERSFLGAPVVWLNFAKPSLAVRIGKTGLWRLVRDTAGGRLARRLYKALAPRLPPI